MSKDKREGWLAELEVGDEVVMRQGWEHRLYKVVGITPSGLIDVSNTRFNQDGRQRGASSSPFDTRRRLVEATPERVARVKDLDRRAQLKQLNWISYSINSTAIQKVYNLLKKEGVL